MVRQHNDVPPVEVLTHTTDGARHDEFARAERVHYAQRECQLLHRVTLIEVQPTLHRDNILTPEFADDDVARMTQSRRLHKVRDLLVGNRGLGVDRFRHPTETCAEDDRKTWLCLRLLLKELSRFFDLFVQVSHPNLLIGCIRARRSWSPKTNIGVYQMSG